MSTMRGQEKRSSPANKGNTSKTFVEGKKSEDLQILRHKNSVLIRDIEFHFSKSKVDEKITFTEDDRINIESETAKLDLLVKIFTECDVKISNERRMIHLKSIYDLLDHDTKAQLELFKEEFFRNRERIEQLTFKPKKKCSKQYEIEKDVKIVSEVNIVNEMKMEMDTNPNPNPKVSDKQVIDTKMNDMTNKFHYKNLAKAETRGLICVSTKTTLVGYKIYFTNTVLMPIITHFFSEWGLKETMSSKGIDELEDATICKGKEAYMIPVKEVVQGIVIFHHWEILCLISALIDPDYEIPVKKEIVDVEMNVDSSSVESTDSTSSSGSSSSKSKDKTDSQRAHQQERNKKRRANGKGRGIKGKGKK